MLKKNTKEEILIEEDSKFFEKYINMAQNVSSNAAALPSEKDVEKPYQRKQEEVTDFFKNLLSGGPNRQSTTVGRTAEQSLRQNAEKDLIDRKSVV